MEEEDGGRRTVGGAVRTKQRVEREWEPFESNVESKNLSPALVP